MTENAFLPHLPAAAEGSLRRAQRRRLGPLSASLLDAFPTSLTWAPADGRALKSFTRPAAPEQLARQYARVFLPLMEALRTSRGRRSSRAAPRRRG